MSYQLERSAIEAYFIAQWAAQTPLGMDGQAFATIDGNGNPLFDRVRLSINSGAQLQGSTGRTSNQIQCVGTLVATIYTEGGKGSAKWRGFAETIIGFLRNTTLSQSGAIITSSADAFVRFSPPSINGGEQQHPYISASFPNAPFHVTNITAPFVRYDFT